MVEFAPTNWLGAIRTFRALSGVSAPEKPELYNPEGDRVDLDKPETYMPKDVCLSDQVSILEVSVVQTYRIEMAVPAWADSNYCLEVAGRNLPPAGELIETRILQPRFMGWKDKE